MEHRAKCEYTVPGSHPIADCFPQFSSRPRQLWIQFPQQFSLVEEKMRENSLRFIPPGVLTTVGFSISTGYSDDKLMSFPFHPHPA